MKQGKTIAIVNQKGGVGKTTTAFNLGACLAEQRKKVLLIDLDQQGNLTYCMGHDVPDEVNNTIAHLMNKAINDEDYELEEYIYHNQVSNQKETAAHQMDYICCNVMMSTVEVGLVNAMSREQVLKYILEELKGEYDYILLDCGPSLGMITINALVAADSVIIPLQAEKFAALGLELLLKNVLRVKRRLNPELDIDGILFVAVAEKYKESRQTVEEVMEKFSEMVNVYEFVIPKQTAVAQSIRKQLPMIACHAEGEIAKLYQRLAKEVMENE